MKKILIILLLACIIVVSGCVDQDQGGVTGEVVAKEGKLILSDENGNPVEANSAILDGNNVEVTEGKIDISGLSEGTHKISIIISGIDYTEDFYYEGEGITIKISKPVETHITVFSKELNKPISDVKIYLDGENKCTTKSDGTCSFFAKPDKCTIRLQGEGIFYEEIKTISSNSNSFTFKVSRTLFADIKVLDKLTNDPVEDASVYLDGSYKGKTDSSGKLRISDVIEGSYNLEAEYKSVRESKEIQVSLSKNNFEIEIEIPKTITLELKDSDTNKPIDSQEVFLEGSTKTYRSLIETDDDGVTNIEDVLPGDYHIVLEDVTSKPSKQITVGVKTYIEETLDMPNPRFANPDISCKERWKGIERVGKCEVKLKNIYYGDKSIDTLDTTVALLVYIFDDETNTAELVDSSLLSLGQIEVGDTGIDETEDLPGFKLFEDEIIVAVIYEGWKYTPEDKDLDSKFSVPQAVAEKWIGDTGDAMSNYCQAHPDKCIEIIAKAFAHLVPA